MPKPVLLLAFADPTRELRIAQEQRAVRDALRDAEGIDGRRGESRWEIVERSGATLEDLRRAFADYRNRVVGFHYAGHATGDRLLLESADGTRRDAHAGGLAAFLGEHRARLQFVFLNACSTGGQVEALLRAGVPAVIATSHEIRDDVAILLATAFYSALGGGAGLRRAFEEAQAIVRAEIGDAPQAAYEARETRGFDLTGAPDAAVAPAALGGADTWPWALTVVPGAGAVDAWSLGAAIGDHTLGLPPLPPGDLPASPYRRLLPFTEREAHVFFGRGATIHALYDRCKDRAGAPVVLLHGQSGAGKSSLVDAGLRPRLGAEFDVRYARRDAALGLGGTLRAALGIAPDAGATELASAWRAQSGVGRPLVVILDQVEEAYTRRGRGDGGTDTAGPIPRDRSGRTSISGTGPASSALGGSALGGSALGGSALGGDGELAALAGDLAALFGDPAARPAGRVLLAFRKEWLPEVEARLAAERVFHAKEFLARLDEDGVVEAIVGPSRLAQYRLELVDEERLARTIARDLLRDPDSPVAPTLQVLLSKMWEAASARADDGAEPLVFDGALYRRLRKGAALSEFLDEQLAALGTTHPDAVSSGLALDLLAFHTTPLATAARREWPELAAEYRDVPDLLGLARRCVDLSLLADVVRRSGDTTGERAVVRRDEALALASDEGPRMLSHDTLAPIVRRAFEGSVRPGQRARRILEARAGEWADGATGRPLDDTDLAHVEAGKSGMRAWTEAERRVVAASEARRAQDEAERAAREREAVRRRRQVRMVSVAFAVVGLVAAGFGLWARRTAARASRAALVAAAVAQEDPVDGALLLATLDTNVVLPNSLQSIATFAQRPIPRVVIDAGGEVISAMMSDDESRIVAVVNYGGNDAVARVWSTDGRGSATRIGGTLPISVVGGGEARAAAISPDGRRVAIVGMVGQIEVWNSDATSTPSKIDAGEGIRRVALMNGDTLLVGWTKFDVRREWRAARPGAPWVEATRALRPAAATPDTTTSRRPNGPATAPRRPRRSSPRAWPEGGGRRPSARPTVPVPLEQVSRVTRARLTRAQDAARPPESTRVPAAEQPLDAQPNAYPPHLFPALDSAPEVPNGAPRRALLTVRGRTLYVWDARGALPALTLRGPRTVAARLQFSADGARLISVDGGHNVRVWHTDGWNGPIDVAPPAPTVTYWVAALSADGRRVALFGNDTLRVRSLDADGSTRIIGRFRAFDDSIDADADRATAAGTLPGDDVSAIAFTRDGRSVVTVHGSTAVLRWNVDSLAPPRRVREPLPTFGSSAFSADYRTVVAVWNSSRFIYAPSDSVRVWSVAGGPWRSLSLNTNVTFQRLGISSDGKRVVIPTRDGDAEIWEPVSRQGISAVSAVWPTAGGASDAAFSPDGRLVALASTTDDVVRVFGSDQSGQVLALPTRTADDSAGVTVTAVAFSADGRRLAVGTSAGKIRVFLVDQRALLGYMRRATTDCLSQSLRQAYLNESGGKARQAWEACERARGREPPETIVVTTDSGSPR